MEKWYKTHTLEQVKSEILSNPKAFFSCDEGHHYLLSEQDQEDINAFFNQPMESYLEDFQDVVQGGVDMDKWKIYYSFTLEKDGKKYYLSTILQFLGEKS